MEVDHHIRTNDSITTLGRISHKTGIIEVQSRFYDLDKKEQDFVIEHLLHRYRSYDGSGDKDELTKKIASDKTALEKMRERYPDVPVKYWLDMLEKIFKEPGSNSNDWKRLDNL